MNIPFLKSVGPRVTGEMPGSVLEKRRKGGEIGEDESCVCGNGDFMDTQMWIEPRR